MNAFTTMLNTRWRSANSMLCVGLDSNDMRIPNEYCVMNGDILDVEETIFAFNEAIVDSTHEYVCAFKPQISLYEKHGPAGLRALKRTIDYIRRIAPDIPIILDFKRGDIDSTNEGYVEFAFGCLGVDAVTLSPYLGLQALEPFLSCADKGLILLCKTSNKGAGEFQDRIISVEDEEAERWGLPIGTTMPLYQLVAYRVSHEWNQYGNCLLVAGATYTQELTLIRQIVADMPLLVPGIGAQGGEVEATVKAGRDSDGFGMIINSSRGVIFHENPRESAMASRDEINKYR